MDPRLSWALVALTIVLAVTVLAVMGIDEGGPVPTGGGGHG
jgi:hypothetical protein